LDQIRAFLKFTGKGERKVVAVFATSAPGAAAAVRYLRRELPDLPVWLFSVAAPDPDTASLCEGVRVESDSMALLVEAQKALWPYWVALGVATWTGGHLRWPVKLAPFLVPPCRALILNRHGDYVPGTPRNISIHLRRLVRDALHSGWHRAQDLARGYALWFFALVAQYFAPLSRLAFWRSHGTASLSLSAPSEGEGVAVFRYAHRQWNWAELEQLIRTSPARYILFLESGAESAVDDLLPLFGDTTFAVSRQVAWRDWKPALFPVAPFRHLQPEEAAQTLGPLSSVILADRAKLAALGLPRTVVPGSAWMLLFWKAAAAGWRSFSVGGDAPLREFPDWPYEDAEFVSRVLSDPALRALGPREPALARGSIAFDRRRPRTIAPAGRPRVLVVSPYLPYPLSHGGAVRIYNLCRSLAGRVDFTLACLREKNDTVAYDKLHEVFREVYVIDRDERAVKDPSLPAQVREHRSESLRALIAHLAGRVDLLQVEFTHMAHFRDAARALPAILVEHDLTFTLYRQFGERAEYDRWLAFERRWFAGYDGIWTMSQQDHAEATANGSPAARTFVIANGVDVDRFRPAVATAEAPEVLYIGSFRHRPNIIGFDKLRTEIMPAVWQRFPETRLRVVAGPDPGKYWTKPRTLDPRILLHAFVSDVRPLYATASVVAVPLAVSAGTNIKVMEAMAAGKPVVSTPVGCQGLDLLDGHDLLVRESSADFACAVCDLLTDPARAAAIATHARATVEARFSWEAIADAAYASYQAIMPGMESRP
jgi:glycosyltransferase involved in cell wall biosynthesis